MRSDPGRDGAAREPPEESDGLPILISAGHKVPLAVVMITLNEAHNMTGAVTQLEGWAREIFVVDSYSSDETVEIALRHGARVVQRPFRGFGDQWNFALNELPITSPWTMKLDPDERLTPKLKETIENALRSTDAYGFSVTRRLWFMSTPLPVRERLVRIWRTGHCRFSEVSVNEHPLVDGPVARLAGDLEHHDSPNLEHWLDKQNRYTTAEAVNIVRDNRLAAEPRLLGTKLQRRMWLKKHYSKLPFRYTLAFLYYFVARGAWRAGWVGYAWARLRVVYHRLCDYKAREMRLTGRVPPDGRDPPGEPYEHEEVEHYD